MAVGNGCAPRRPSHLPPGDGEFAQDPLPGILAFRPPTTAFAITTRWCYNDGHGPQVKSTPRSMAVRATLCLAAFGGWGRGGVRGGGVSPLAGARTPGWLQRLVGLGFAVVAAGAFWAATRRRKESPAALILRAKLAQQSDFGKQLHPSPPAIPPPSAPLGRLDPRRTLAAAAIFAASVFGGGPLGAGPRQEAGPRRPDHSLGRRDCDPRAGLAQWANCPASDAALPFPRPGNRGMDSRQRRRMPIGRAGIGPGATGRRPAVLIAPGKRPARPRPRRPDRGPNRHVFRPIRRGGEMLWRSGDADPDEPLAPLSTGGCPNAIGRLRPGRTDPEPGGRSLPPEAGRNVRDGRRLLPPGRHRLAESEQGFRPVVQAAVAPPTKAKNSGGTN